MFDYDLVGKKNSVAFYAAVSGSVLMKRTSSSFSCKSFKHSVAHLFSFPTVSDILIFAVHVLDSSPQVPSCFPCLEQSLLLAVQALLSVYLQLSFQHAYRPSGYLAEMVFYLHQNIACC